MQEGGSPPPGLPYPPLGGKARGQGTGKRRTPAAVSRTTGCRRASQRNPPTGSSKQETLKDRDGWQTPRKTARAKPYPDSEKQGVPLRNRFEGCQPETDSPAQEVAEPVGGERLTLKPHSKPPGTPQSKRKTRVWHSKVATADLPASEEVTNVAQIPERPYKSSYFLPGRIEGRALNFLVDTGCNTNLLAKHVFDRLPRRVKDQLEECETHGRMADGTKLPFYGVLRVPTRLRDVRIEETYVVSQLSEDAILGMPFLAAHECALSFQKPVLTIDGQELACSDRHGRLLASRVQVLRPTTIPVSYTHLTLPTTERV